jgi:hypothetical protein
MVTGNLMSRVDGGPLHHPTGLGHWHGVSFSGQQGQKFTIITTYRVCAGSVKTASMDSAFYREYEHFITPTQKTVNPRRLFLRDLQDAITQLQTARHAIVLMMDANATLSSDPHLSEFMESCMLSDLHEWDPAPSTFIGAPNR